MQVARPGENVSERRSAVGRMCWSGMDIDLHNGILVAIEGIDGSGKSTQAGLLTDVLSAAGLRVCRTREPTDGQWGAELRRSAVEGRLSPERELELFMLDRREHVETCIAPAIARGE